MKIKFNFEKINVYKILIEYNKNLSKKKLQQKEKAFCENRIKHINFYKEKNLKEKHNISYIIDKLSKKELSNIIFYNIDASINEFLFCRKNNKDRFKVISDLSIIPDFNHNKELNYKKIPLKDTTNLLLTFNFNSSNKGDILDLINRCKNYFALYSSSFLDTLKYIPYNTEYSIEYMYILYINGNNKSIGFKNGQYVFNNESIYKYIKEGIMIKCALADFNIIVDSFDSMVNYIDYLYDINTTYIPKPLNIKNNIISENDSINNNVILSL